MDPTENTAFIVGGACLLSCFLAIEVYSCGVEHLENTSTVLLTARVCWTIYRAIAWQRHNKIRYIAPSLRLLIPGSLTVHCLFFLSEVSSSWRLLVARFVLR
jgi:hypothetical protein